MQYKIVKLLSRIACCLPAGLRRLIGVILGKICWIAAPRRRKIMAIENIKIGLKLESDQAKHIAKKSTTRFGNMFLEVLRFPKLTSSNISNSVSLVGDEYLKEALSYGRGVILATAHSGNWELLGASLALNGYPLVGVAQKQDNDQIDKFINEYRTLTGMHITYKSGVLEMVRLLGQNKIIGLLMDQDAHEGGAFVDFLGRKASTPKGAAVLARMKSAPIVPALITETGYGTHKVICHPIVWVQKTQDKEQDILSTTQVLTNIIAAHVKKYPHEWFWLHNRWKTRMPQ